MSYISKPVKIPDVPGKITLRERGDRVYVLYEIGRTYNPALQINTPQRKMIGQQIRNAPDMMLPNENYEQFFANGEEIMSNEELVKARDYEKIRGEYRMLNSLFEQLYYEFQIMAHRSPHYVVNAYKKRQINKVLEPLREIMKDEVYARFLEKLEEPEMVTDPDGNEKLTGLDYSDVALALTQYRGAMTRFAADRLM
ncbi:MAG: hypothetical protein IJQ71_10965 [Clostridia bacterium]|nr:hypothetical protein [Clostridia bacterium]